MTNEVPKSDKMKKNDLQIVIFFSVGAGADNEGEHCNSELDFNIFSLLCF